MVSLFCEELDRKSSHISHRISTALLPSGGTEPEKHWRLLANTIEEFCGSQVGYVVSDLELTPSAGSLSMNDSA